MKDFSDDSIKDLEDELEGYKKQKKKVDALVNMIGGKKGLKRTIFIDRILLISIKVVWISHKRSQTEHFMFWFLSSLEARINIAIDEIRKQKENSADR